MSFRNNAAIKSHLSVMNAVSRDNNSRRTINDDNKETAVM